MFARAALFCIALIAAAVSVAFATTPRAHADAALTYSLCAGRAETEYRQSLPLSHEEELLLSAGGSTWQRPLSDEEWKAVDSLSREQCGQPPPRDRVELRAGLNVAWLVGGGFVLYATAPRRRIFLGRLLRLRPTPGSRYRPDLAAVVYRLAADSEVTLSGVWLDASDYTQNALAFGYWRRRHIELASGMTGLFDDDPHTFEVIVRHELGHIRGRDVDVTFAITALWGAFVVLVVAALGYSLSGKAAGEGGLRDLGYRLLALSLIVLAARNTYLHAREFHADAYAATGPSSPCGRTARMNLDRFLGHLAFERAARATRRAATRGEAPPSSHEPPDPQDEGTVWPFATHPPLARRRAVLVDPSRADELSGWEAALIGCVAMCAVTLLMAHSFDVMLFRLNTGDLRMDEISTLQPVYAWLALPLLLPAGTVLGRGVWATVAAGSSHGALHSAARLAGVAGGLWIGLALGAQLSQMQGGEGWPDSLTAMWWQGKPD
ncbi:M48 family metalloprotease [Streptomyces avermitilis]|uniref:M48 family metalloprotease n=1 Tax=Streptomyces avermitilis TaxID=33903 RepID=UPI0033B94F44